MFIMGWMMGRLVMTNVRYLLYNDKVINLFRLFYYIELISLYINMS